MNSITNTASQLNKINLAEKYDTNNTAEAEAGKHSDKVSLGQTRDAAKTANNEQIKDGSVYLSSRALRAQKIDNMAQDFFADGQFTSADLPQLIQRLHQDGILSQTQLTRLSDEGIEVPKSQGKVDDMKTFIESTRSEIEATAADNTTVSTVLIKLLDDAENVLDNMANVQSKEISQQAARVSSQLNVFLQGDVEMSAGDAEQWRGLRSLMQLASSMGDNQQANGQLNGYLALGK
ncbi:hypothetical protein HQQ94_15290 [Shewanella sp. VB17]|uniref:hypothetical protein n=1 Tax=Shewanella sp. VB17 TaxID=2739432 RepID=UPI001566C5B8|nr:hypothetical protein [Shewanella sp. VB17]NRD74576.1 hypothetical protein [Shewanella sp. VB17]